MPAIYRSFAFTDGDSIDQRQQKLYLGMISCGEDAYALGAAIAECRKTLAGLIDQLASLDGKCDQIAKEFHAIKKSRKQP